MRVRMLERKEEHDAAGVVTYRKGEHWDLPADKAEAWIAAGVAVESPADGAPAAEEEPQDTERRRPRRRAETSAESSEES